MNSESAQEYLSIMRERYPEKFAPEQRIFSNIRAGDRIFISTGCGEPQYLVGRLINYVEDHPKAFFDAEILHVWTMGVAPYTDKKFKSNFRLNSFFVNKNTRDAINTGLADYSPIFLSHIPDMFREGLIPSNVALIQVSLPDKHGYMSLGISVDIVKAAIESASLIIAQVNPQMPRVHGDTFVHMDDINFLLPFDEPLLEYTNDISDDIADRIGTYVAKLVKDGDTIQVGYGSIPNAILTHLKTKKDLGVHTELFSDGIADLMRCGAVTNSRKSLHKGKSVAAFCMGSASTYEFIHDNPSIDFRPIDHTNNPLTIAKNRAMTAINSALQIDLTGQVTAESIGTTFFSGIGGQADFMRGAILSPGGKTILALQSTAENGTISRILPTLSEGAAVSLIRGDIHYVVTEYGIAYLRGKNVRERAMALISIAHPKFKAMLIKRAKELNYIYPDQAFIPGKRGAYPEHLEVYRSMRDHQELFLRPVRISDEPLLKDFFYSLSDQSLYRRFISVRKDMHHERLQEFVIIDYTREIVILATIHDGEREIVVGIGQFGVDERSHTAEVAFVVRDEYHKKGIGFELLSYLTFLAKKQGLLGFTAEVLVENRPMLNLFEKMGFDIERRNDEGVYELNMSFGGKQ
jgi:acyl-CoA hydrolase/ribosomal protein S18 acetylase RimI-like enzyme